MEDKHLRFSGIENCSNGARAYCTNFSNNTIIGISNGNSTVCFCYYRIRDEYWFSRLGYSNPITKPERSEESTPN